MNMEGPPFGGPFFVGCVHIQSAKHLTFARVRTTPCFTHDMGIALHI